MKGGLPSTLYSQPATDFSVPLVPCFTAFVLVLFPKQFPNPHSLSHCPVTCIHNKKMVHSSSSKPYEVIVFS